MNIYEKLVQARVKLQNIEMKKTGRNTFSNYNFFELSDFLPDILKIEKELNFLSLITFGKEEATLTLVNCEKPEEQITFSCEIKSANLKGCHEVQSYGAVQTYTRRYLYVMAYEIVEHDALDENTGKEDKPKKNNNYQKTVNVVNWADVKAIQDLAISKGYTKDDVETSSQSRYKKKVSALTKEEYNQLYQIISKIEKREQNKNTA